MTSKLARLLLIGAITVLTPAALFQANTPAALACNCNKDAPTDGGGGSKGGPPAGFMYIPDQKQGVLTDLSGDPADGFDFAFNNPYGSSASYDYTYTLYDSNGHALTTVTVSGNQLVGPSGDVWFAVDPQYQGSTNAIGVTITVYSPDSTPTNIIAAPGNGHAHAP